MLNVAKMKNYYSLDLVQVIIMIIIKHNRIDNTFNNLYIMSFL